MSNETGTTDYKWIPNQLRTTMSEGYSWLRMDKNGYNNEIIPESIDILLMGSSHMEAYNVAVHESTASVLNKLLPDFSVYNVGMSGHDIYRVVKNIKSAVSEFKPKKFIVIETDRIRLDKNMIEKVIYGELADIPSYNSGLMYFVQRYCPAIKSIYKQIEDWRSSDQITVSTDKTVQSEIDIGLLESFFEKIKADSGSDISIIIFYHPIMLIDDEGKLILSNEDDVALFSMLCEKKGITFVDTTSDMVKLYHESHILPRGFINTGIGSGHINKFGHQVIAETIMDDQHQ